MTTTDSGYIQLDGARLYYETAGEGDPLVFVHGFTLNARMWDDQWDAFASDYKVVRYDARGFGRSDTATGPYCHWRDLRAVVQHLASRSPTSSASRWVAVSCSTTPSASRTSYAPSH